ncbi:hypothetical protein L1887_32354 [Cichorium endivia]|nr:hypothetical protein L1887_32354 [Cichorium endivia]
MTKSDTKKRELPNLRFSLFTLPIYAVEESGGEDEDSDTAEIDFVSIAPLVGGPISVDFLDRRPISPQSKMISLDIYVY